MDPKKPPTEATRTRSLVRYWPVGLTLAVGTLITLWMFALVEHHQAERRQQRFRQQVDNAATAMGEKLRDNLEVLYSMRDLYGASSQVNRADFQRFASGQRFRQSGIHALEWIPRVTAAERPRFERAARQAGVAGFRFTEAGPDGRLKPAGPRAEYFPVYYVEPYAGNELALGYAPVLPARDAAIEQAWRTGQAVATGRIRLVQESAQQNGLAIFVPVFRSGRVPATPEARHRDLMGLVEGVYRLDDMMHAAVEGLDLSGLSLTLTDESAPPQERLLATHVDPGVAAGDPRTFTGPTWQKAFDMGGRRWSMSFYSRSSQTDPIEAPWGILFGGFLVTGLAGVSLYNMVDRQEQIEHQVELRTTELTKAEEALREERDRAQRYLDVAGVMIVVIDPEGRLTLANRKAGEILGYTPAEMVGKPWFKTFVPDSARSQTQEAFRTIMTQGAEAASQVESLVRTRQGDERRIVWHNVTLRDPGGRLVGLLCSGSDVTDYKRAIEEVAHREAELANAREIDRLKSNFVSAISHDLRTPLTSIKGYAEFLADGIGGELSDQQTEFVSHIERGTKRLENLVDDLLDFARVDAGTFTLRREPVDLGGLLQEVAASMQPQFEENHLRLSVCLSPEPLVGVLDQQRIERVLANLLSNAVKFTPPGGEIRLRAERVEAELRCEVEDSGPGIDPLDMPKLFQRFSQLATGQHKGGTGLGLSISKAIIEAHGGRIGVTSERGEGATFWFTLPAPSSTLVGSEGMHHAPDRSYPRQ